MISLLAVAVLAAAPDPFIEPWGLRLEAKHGVVIITAVRRGSIADRAKLVAGTRLLRILSTTPETSGAVGTLEAEDLPSAVSKLSASGLAHAAIEVPASDRYDRGIRFLDASIPPGHPRPAHFRAFSVASVGFDPAKLTREVYLDRESKAVLGLWAGRTSGSTVYVRERLQFSCGDNQAQRATLRGPSFPQPLVVDLAPRKINSSSVEISFPVAKLNELRSCSDAPRMLPIDLELQCAGGAAPVYGRERLRLSVKCGEPERVIFDAFQVSVPHVRSQGLVEDNPRFEVQPPRMDGDENEPLAVGLIITDAAGKVVLHSKPLWTRDPKATAETKWEQLELPAPRVAGEYAVRYEARFPDGSTAQSATRQVKLTTAAEETAERQKIHERFAAKERMDQRMKDEKIELCDASAAVPWLRKQPEIDWVSDARGADYSFRLKEWPAPTIVHCHH